MGTNTGHRIRKTGIVAGLGFICLLLAGCSGRNVSAKESGTAPGQEEGVVTVIWALPSYDAAPDMITTETLEAFNRKLETDGYSFRLTIETYDTGDPQGGKRKSSGEILSGLQKCQADIATIALQEAGEQIGEEAQRMGLFEALDKRLAGSVLYDSIPETCWESVRYRNCICYVPPEYVLDDGLHLYVRGQIPEDLPDEFDGEIQTLGDYLTADTPMYYEVSNFKFAEALGYAFDSGRGLLVTADGNCVNPLSEEPVVGWLRRINRWYHEGKVRISPREMKQCRVLFTNYSLSDAFWQDWEDYCQWKGYAFHRIGNASGILAASQKKDAAFRLLELLHTDHSYGNLLIYGKKALEDENPEKMRYFIAQLMFGLDTGLRWDGNWGRSLFSDAEEKKKYYKENILPSPSLYWEFPAECTRLVEIEDKYLSPEPDGRGEINPASSILTCDDFDAKLKEFREELKEPMDEVLEKLAAQRS